jgi:TRAP-type C4-dicarboxylate transport system permease small subunit
MAGREGFSVCVKAASKALNILSLCALVAMMLLTVADVLLRYCANRPIVGGTEITEYMMVFLTLGIPLSLLAGRSIKMELLVQKLPKKAQDITDTATLCLGLFFALLLTFQLLKDVGNVRSLGIVSNTLRIPAYPFYLVMTSSFAVLDLVMVLEFFKRIRGKG